MDAAATPALREGHAPEHTGAQGADVDIEGRSGHGARQHRAAAFQLPGQLERLRGLQPGYVAEQRYYI